MIIMIPKFINLLKQSFKTRIVFHYHNPKLFTIKSHQKYSSDVKLSFRSHTCGDLNSSHTGQDVTLCGWLQFNRGKFLTLRDSHGVIQVLLNDSELEFLRDIPHESVLKVKGIVHLRPEAQVNRKMKTGDIEILANAIDVLGLSKPNLPFRINDYTKVSEVVRLKYRYLDLRNPMMQHNLKFRSDFSFKIRNFLIKEYGFVEVETPTLFRRTPGGAKEYLVPTKLKGKFYSLTQSPQQFKQMLMIGAIDRYFQIARCYRDENIKRDRQPEFTQIDLEMSFVTAESIMTLIEEMLRNVWPNDHPIKIPFTTLTYQECQQLYGTDKPDLRHNSQIKDVTTILNASDSEFIKSKLKTLNHTIQALVFEKKEVSPEAKVELKEPTRFLENEEFFQIEVKENGLWKTSINKHISPQLQKDLNAFLNVGPGQQIFLSFGTRHNACQVLGKIRETICKFLDFTEDYKFLWVTDFPLFEQSSSDSGTGNSFESVHHPFTAPHPDDMDKLKDPQKLLEIRGQHYDLVLNGQEIGGGSVRINDGKLQKYILEDILKEDASELQYFIDALESGCPPHAGIALGLDRLISILCNTKNIRDVIAFPKSLDGKDLMSGAPSNVSKKELDVYFS